MAVRRGASATGAAVEAGWLVEEGEFRAGSEVDGAGVEEVDSFAGRPVADSGRGEVMVTLLLFGFVMGMADLGTVRDAITLARARW